MENLRKKKIVALFGIFILVMIIAGIFALSKYDKYKGLISLKNANTKLLGDVSGTIHGTEEIKYEIKYTLDTIENVPKRDVVIKGTLNSNYARFKEINNKKISSEVTNDGKEILLTIKDVPLGEEQSLNLKINVLNAPNNEEIKPVIEIKEVTGEYRKLDTDSLVVETNSVEGIVYDENNLKVDSIELSLYKNGTEIKRTYTSKEGRFVFSDLEEGNYIVKVEEDIYELASDSRTTENNDSLILLVKESDRFNIETHKYITNLKLVVDGKETNYSYNDVEKVVKSIKKYKTVSGSIEYKIVLQNNSDKSSRIKEVVDDLQDGLSFDESKNPGWKVVDNKLKYLPLEDVVLEPFEKREAKITLDIKNTKELKTYINKLTTRGEVNERVVFILDGKEVRNINVLEGDKITNPDENILWYTDRNLTNEYNFNHAITKDLILYGVTKEKTIGTFTVTYLDQGNLFYEETVEENTPATKPADIPTKAHSVFTGWYLNEELFNFNTLITEDITLNSKFEEVEAPTINKTPDGWTNEGVLVTLSSDHDDYTYMYKIDNGSYQEYTSPFRINENSTVYAYSVKEGITSIEVSEDIDNIDNIVPSINNMELTDITPVSANLDLRILDEQSGLKKYRVYVDNVLVFESPEYTTNLNDEKTETYLVSNLDELNTYIIKLEIEDIVGNKTYDTLTLETPAKHYVARTLNYAGTEIEKYESLKEAIDSDTCLSDCHIEMLDDVTESNIISENQDITIDLNGKVISSSRSYVLYNNGSLTIIDTNENDIGKVSGSNTAIVSDGTLQIGQNEVEPEVDEYKPIIEGTTSGVETTGILNYYDGHMIGDVPINGLVTNTPYLYNTKIEETPDGTPESKLIKVADAVAVINSVYYSEAQTAIDKAAKGYEQEVDYTKPLLAQLKSDDDYRFVYNETGKVAINNNKWVKNTIAHSYIKLDLTNYTDNQMLTINAELDSYYGAGYILLTSSSETPQYDSTEGRLAYLYRVVEAKDYKTILQKGEIYYLHLFYKNVNESGITSKTDVLKINKLSLGNFDAVPFEEISEANIYNDNSYYGFSRQEDNSLINDNVDISKTKAHSYFIVDLTNVNENKYLAINAETISSSTSNRGYISVTNSIDMPSTRQIELSGNKPEKTYEIELIKNQINVVHFCYEINASYDSGKMIIKSIIPITTDAESSIISDGEMHNNGTYYFVEQEDGSYKNNNQGMHSTTANSYMVFDLTGIYDYVALSANVTVSSESGFDFGYITVTDNDTAPAHNQEVGRYYRESGESTTDAVIPLISNKINYVHFGYRKDSSSSRGADTFTINSLSLIYRAKTPENSIDYISTKAEAGPGTETIPVLNQNPDTVKLVKNVTLSQPLEITNTRDVILDLNGKTLTTSANDYVVENNGSLKIIDSDFENRTNINTEYKLEQARMFASAKEQYLSDKAEYEEYAGLCENCEPSEEYAFDQTLITKYDYTGEEEEYIAASSGNYKIEVWGASGGNYDATDRNGYSANTIGGKGGYSVGTISLNEGDKLYINVGGAGQDIYARSSNYHQAGASGGYNGGGNGGNGYNSGFPGGSGGGGATHVATKSGLLSNPSLGIDDIIIVAGGGGGAGWLSGGASGGGATGGSTTTKNVSVGGSQESGYQFGQGSPGYNGINTSASSEGSSGSGGGLFGGSTYSASGAEKSVAGAGGSGYISNNNLNDKKMVMYSADENYISTDESTKTEITTSVSDTAIANYAKSGNGYARITRLLSEEESEEIRSNFPKTYNVKTMPIFKEYILNIDFASSIDIDSLDVNSNDVSYNNTVDDALYGNVYSTTNSTILNNYGAYMNIDQGNIILDKSGAYNAITNRGRLTLGEEAYITTKQSDNIGIYNDQAGDILDGSGSISTLGAKSYGILNESANDSNIKGYKIDTATTNSYNFYNRNYCDLVLDSITTSGNGMDIYQNSSNNLTIKNSMLGSRNNDSYDSDPTIANGIITFDKSNILNRIVGRTIAKINISNSNLVSSSNTQNLYNYGLINIENTNITNKSNTSNSDYIRDDNWNREVVSSIINYGTINIKNGSIDNLVSKQTRYDYIGIFNNESATVNIKGTFETDNNYELPIVNKGNLTLGNKEDSVSNTYPNVKGIKVAVYSLPTATFNYYDGRLNGPIGETLIAIITDAPVSYDLHNEGNDGAETIYLESYAERITNENYIASVGTTKFVSIQDAIDFIQASNNETEIKLLKDIYTSKNNIIPNTKNISINQDGHTIRTFANPSWITNNGTFKLKDTSNNVISDNITFGYLIKNNGTATYENIKTKSGALNKTGILLNNETAVFNINSGDIYSYETTLINNAGALNINGGKIRTTNPSNTEYSKGNLIENSATGNIILNGGEFSHFGDYSLINNYGRVEVINPKVDLAGNFWHTTRFITNVTSDSYASITGGIYGTSAAKGMLLLNAGTGIISNVTSPLQLVARNTGNLTITGGTYNTWANGSYDAWAGLYSSGGTVNIDGITISNSVYMTIKIEGTANMEISNSTISNTATNSNSFPIYKAGSGTLTLTNDTISSDREYGIMSTGTGTLNLVSGSVTSSNKAGIYVDSSSTLNIGTQGVTVSKNNPRIEGLNYGLYHNTATSTVNFYDGVIIGNTAIYGTINTIEDGYEIIMETKDGKENKYLDNLPVVRNKDTDTPYYSIQDAIDHASNGDTIELIREYTTMPTAETIINDKNIIFDLMGYKIQQNNENLFINNGTLTVQSSETGGMIESNSKESFINNGTLNIESGSYHQATENDMIKNNENSILNINGGDMYCSETGLIYNDGSLTINAGKIRTTSTKSSGGRDDLIENSVTGTVILNGGEFRHLGKYSVVKNYGHVEAINPKVDLAGDSWYTTKFITNVTNDSYASITGGTYGTTSSHGTLIENAGTGIISNVTSSLRVVALNTGNLTINGGTYNTWAHGGYDAVAGIYSSSGTVNISGITINNSSHITVKVEGTTNMEISDSTISSSSTSTSAVAIYKAGSGTLTLINDTISSNEAYGITSTGTGTLNLVSGSVNAADRTAIYVDSSSILNIGTKGDSVSENNPRIEGTDYGLYNNTATSTVNFYDGVIIGNTAIYGTINTIEDGYEIIMETKDGKENKYLDILPVVRNKETGTPYDTIQDAIDHASNGDTIELIREYTSTPTTETVINNKNIIFDLKGYKIQQNNENLFINNGTLTVQSSETGGMIESNSKEAFINNGTLNIESGSYHQATTNDMIKSNENATLNINGGDMYCSETGLIYNDGALTINAGKLRTTSTHSSGGRDDLIENSSTGTIMLYGGELRHLGEYAVIKNYGYVEAINPKVDLVGDSWHITRFIKNVTSDSYASITGGTYGETSSRGTLLENAGTGIISNITSPLRMVAINTGNLTITGGTYNTWADGGYESKAGIHSTSGTVNISGITINNSNVSVIKIDGNSNLNINGDILTTGNRSLIDLAGTGTTNVNTGTIKSPNNYAFNITGATTLNIGTPGGIPSTSDPVVEGKDYAIFNNNLNSKIYFYDGAIRGETAPISGVITDYEPGYKEDRHDTTDPDTGTPLKESTLTMISDEVKTVTVGNVNFVSLQSAVNYAVTNNINRLDLYHDIDLTSDITKPFGIEVNIYLNGYSINQNGHSIDSGIHLITDNEPDNNLGASIFNNKENSENIVIYELSDGSELIPTNTYKLYKLNNDYELIKVKENRIGNYDIGNGTEELRTADGRIYINNITEGTYKLKGSDNKEISFEITSDGVSSNIRINKKVIINRVVEAIATVILTIQTGTTRLPFILFIVLIMIVISSLIVIKKHKRI